MSDQPAASSEDKSQGESQDESGAQSQERSGKATGTSSDKSHDQSHEGSSAAGASAHSSDPSSASNAGSESMHAAVAGHGDSSAASGAKDRLKAKFAALGPALKEALRSVRGAIPALIVKVKQGPRAMLSGLIGLPVLLLKGDLITRLLVLALLASIGLATLSTVQLYRRFAPELLGTLGKQDEHAGEPVLDDEKKLAILASNIVFLERFEGALKSRSGKVNGFEIELYVETFNSDDAGHLRGHFLAVREAVTGAIQDADYEKLMTDEGKEALKEEIRESVERELKRWSPKGRIKGVFFTRFVMG